MQILNYLAMRYQNSMKISSISCIFSAVLFQWCGIFSSAHILVNAQEVNRIDSTKRNSEENKIDNARINLWNSSLNSELQNEAIASITDDLRLAQNQQIQTLSARPEARTQSRESPMRDRILGVLSQ